MVMNAEYDSIMVYGSANDVRWSRRSHGNNKIVAATSEAYSDMESAMENISRTQRGPYKIYQTHKEKGSVCIAMRHSGLYAGMSDEVEEFEPAALEELSVVESDE